MSRGSGNGHRGVRLHPRLEPRELGAEALLALERDERRHQPPDTVHGDGRRVAGTAVRRPDGLEVEGHDEVEPRVRGAPLQAASRLRLRDLEFDVDLNRAEDLPPNPAGPDLRAIAGQNPGAN